MRLEKHPILEFKRGKKVTFTFNGQEVEGYEGETIAAALHAAGIRKLSESQKLHRPRGLFCAIGNCSSCLMKVDGIPNVKICITKVREGMRVEEQKGKGDLSENY
ncbi:pyridine nucleotide-disulfide oxidoreductase [Anoxybacter fermentans]|uniref:Pyridine nucleotide-disulfide oxidoreductase n=1 Tax=Anoxybacter fermentans TaxID=1323375 RepID=A0A3S9SW08_9FIRM|nr:(2Fe-2S)-binding protein [Anoxybacter fermentans]AZR72469.1 pyridine nucleotide-disulfide oxidoreductase [Anoxybacter fermentans]